ncbi:hypothetical protein KIN20_001500, partial [Parelaphostrongylus tenuis]
MELTSEQIRLLMVHEWLFGSMANVTSERINLAWGEDTVDKSTVCRTVKKRESEFYARGIDLLPEKWQKVLDVDGKYFDEQFCLCSGVI